MAGTNASVLFDYEKFGKFPFELMPKNVCLSFAVNPYNGAVVMRYNRNPEAMVVIEDLLDQVFDKLNFISLALDDDASFSDLVRYYDGDLILDKFEPCPFCGHEPECRVHEVFYETEGWPEEVFEIVCCDGRTTVDGFDSRIDAVRFWNDRARRVA